MGVKPVSVGIVGAGNMAREHIRAFAAQPGCSVTGICSRTRDKAAALATEFGIAHVAPDLHELYAEAAPDILVVTVNAEAIHEVARAALGYPWTLLLEKPAGLSLQEAEQLAAVVEGADAAAYVALNRRFLGATEHAIASLDAESHRFIHVQDQQSLAAARQYGYPQKVLSNWMFANSIHLVDYFAVFGRGEITEVTPLEPWQGEATRVVLAHICFDSGDTGLYQGIWQGPGPWAVTVTCPEQRWEMRPLEVATHQAAGSREQEVFAMPDLDTRYKPGFYRQAEELLRAHRGEASKAVSVAAALRSTQLVARIFTP